MTIAVVVKVFDGIVLAADSASTLTLFDRSPQVYNNANKIFHLHRGKPIAAMTWGLGNIGAASISELAKGARRALMGKEPARADWELADHYQIGDVAHRIATHFAGLYAAESAVAGELGPLGLLVAGYSSGQAQAEA